MFKRFAANFALIFLFAFAQIGAVTHEIGHLADYTKHNQQDKNTHGEQCKQCISYAEVASGLQSTAFVLPILNAGFINTTSVDFNFQSTLNTPYAARAPPQIA